MSIPIIIFARLNRDDNTNYQMKKLCFLLLFAIGYLVAPAQEVWDSQANAEAVVLSGNARFTVLTPQMIRIQFSTKKLFEDRATFAVVNRKLDVPAFTQREEDGYLYIETEYLSLRYKIGAIIRDGQKNGNTLRITFKMNGRDINWYPGKDDALNLLGTYRTLDGNIGDTHRAFLEKGLLSRDGWAILNESPSAQRGDGSKSFPFDKTVDGIPWVDKPLDAASIDWYFLGYGHDYKKALGDYVRIAGRQPLPPLYMFGYWYSKYQAYTASQFQQIVNDMDSKKVPHDVIMFDCDWHQNTWTGWSWNKSLIPNPTSLLSWMHNKKLKVSLNLHPADGISNSDDNFAKIRSEMGLPTTADHIPWQLEDSTFYRAFTKYLLRVREKEGVDFWWLDWQQDLTSSYIAGLGETFWLNHVFYNDMKINRPDRRPVIFHRWGGMGSHRYPIGFSGDTFATYGTLQFESYFTATAANACFGYWGHDGGGYLQPNEIKTDPELVLRWMQFCVFTPIFRTHGSSQSGCERRIWKFANFDLQNEAFKLRYTLVPYIYTHARIAYDTGVSICRPLYYEWPEENKAYSVEDEYLFGENILVSPVAVASDANDLSAKTTWLPEGRWFDVCRNRFQEGNTTIKDAYALNEIPYFIREGSIIPCNPQVMNLKSQPEQLDLWVIPGAEGSFTLYEDEGDTEEYRNGAFATTQMHQHRKDGTVTLTIAGRQGVYKNMPAQRSLRVVFFAQDKPEMLTVDGEECTDYTYDETKKQLIVMVAKKDCSLTTTIVLHSRETGVDETSEANSLAIRYDNGARCIMITSDGGSALMATVVDMQGKEWVRVNTSNRTQTNIDLKHLPAGQYICCARTAKDIQRRKFIKY